MIIRTTTSYKGNARKIGTIPPARKPPLTGYTAFMRLLIAIPHYFSPGGGTGHGSLEASPAPRIQSFTRCLAAIRQHFGRPQCILDIARRTTTPANHALALSVEVIVCTAGDSHLLSKIPLNADYFTHRPTAAEPKLLGFECHAALQERLADRFDFYGYLEDDLVFHDPLFFVKLRWFANRFGEESLLLPNRFEVARNRIVHKAYVDGPIRERATAGLQDRSEAPELRGEVLDRTFVFRRPSNPHSGCFFLTHSQMATWSAKPWFLDRDTRFIGPLESAASLGVMKTFRVYKPAPENGGFLEIEHAGAAFLSRIKAPPA